uniref:polynucleotide adenylyltransferase n=1 Tax=Araucaria cunninghamii TaxID=56994 RepID=A0A0D6QZM7_ARACU
MADAEEVPILYETLSPLFDCNDTTDDTYCPELVLDEAADASPTHITNPKTMKRKSIKLDVAVEAPESLMDEELRFLNRGRASSPEPRQMPVSTVFRREIGDTEDGEPRNASDGEVEYFSLEVRGSNSPEEVSAEPVTPDVTFLHEEENLPAVQEFPWMDVRKKIKSPALLLHQEIIDFCNFLSPTTEEEAARRAAVGRVSEVIKFIWPNCQVKLFGSFETGLYLPSSDIDVVILNSNVQVPQKGLKALAKALSKKSVGTKIQVIGSARVPIIKFFEKESNVAFDISFDVQNGPEAAKFIKDAIEKIPPLRPLCLILKIFLQQRDLNEVFSGGIGSYALLVMLITHLQVHGNQESSTGRSMVLERNLGILLIDFFDLYGRKLNAYDVGISCRSGGQFFRKNPRGFRNSKRPHLLSVEDPQAPENDIGKNSYNILKVRAAFALAHRKLTDIKIDNLISSQHSILGQIIRVDAKLLERKAVLMKIHCIDISLSIASNRAIDSKSDLDGDGIRQDSLIENQGNLLNRWQLLDDEPLPRGGELSEDVCRLPSAKRGFKRKWNEEKFFEKKDERKKEHLQKNNKDGTNVSGENRPSKKVKNQQNDSTTQHSMGLNSKKRRQISEDESHSATRHGPRWRKFRNSSKQEQRKHSESDSNRNLGTRTIANSSVQKKIKLS